MNWKKIKEDCPKASKELDIEFNPNKSMTAAEAHAYRESIKMRMLYDFFDGQGLIINVFDNTATGRSWMFIIWKQNDKIIHPSVNDPKQPCYPTRTEAETAAFTKAFELLEEKLIISTSETTT